MKSIQIRSFFLVRIWTLFTQWFSIWISDWRIDSSTFLRLTTYLSSSFFERRLLVFKYIMWSVLDIKISKSSWSSALRLKTVRGFKLMSPVPCVIYSFKLWNCRKLEINNWSKQCLSHIRKVIDRTKRMWRDTLIYRITNPELQLERIKPNPNHQWPMCEKCSNTEFLLVRIFPYSVQIPENTDQKKLHIWTISTQWTVAKFKLFPDSQTTLKYDSV